MQSLAATFFSSPGHDVLVADILSLLDWRSILAAGLVCQEMNTVVRTSPAVQLVLREAYYALPTGYLRFDRGVFDKYERHGDRLNRMIDVFSRWQRGSPATVHRMGEPSISKFSMSHGLVAACGAITDHTKIVWNNEYDNYSEIERPIEFDAEPYATRWAVYDVRNLRDVEFDPSQHPGITKWTVEAGHKFEDIEIDRVENVALVSRAKHMHRTVGTQEKHFLYVTVKAYLLEPTDEFTWKDGDTVAAIPHPEAKGVEFELDCDDANIGSYGSRMPCSMRAGPNGTVLTEILGFPQTLWSWKTGKRVLDSLLSKESVMLAPVIAMKQHEHQLLGIDNMAMPTLTFFNLFGSTPVPYGSIALPAVSKAFLQSSFATVSDVSAKLVTLYLSASNRNTRQSAYTMTLRLDRAFQPDPETSTLTDTAYWNKRVCSAVCGYRAVSLEGPLSMPTARGTDPYRLYISDYRASQPERGADTLHPSPLGCKPAATVKPTGMTLMDQRIKYRRNQMGGRKIPYEYSDAWDKSEEPGASQTQPLLPDWKMTASGCPRTAVEIGLEECEAIRFIETDADHLYICTVSGVTILSF